MEFNFEGLVAATVMPVHQSGTINSDVIPQYIDYLLKQGVKGVFVNGTTGEWPSFSITERKEICEHWVKHGKGRLTIIIHIGSYSIQDAKEMARHAESLGVDAIGCISPCYFKPENEEILVDTIKDVASAAPNTPFLYYHIPCFTGIEIDMEKFLNLAYEGISTFSGLKLTSLKLADLYPCLNFKKKKLALFCGFDMQLYSGLVFGANAAVGCCYNYLGTEFNSLLKAFYEKRHDDAKEIQMKIANDIIPFEKKYGIGIHKLLTTIRSGIDMGSSRLPIKQFTEEQVNEIKKKLSEIGYM